MAMKIIPDDMMIVSIDALEGLLDVAIERGDILGYADDDYRQWLSEIKSSRPTPHAPDNRDAFAKKDLSNSDGNTVIGEDDTLAHCG